MAEQQITVAGLTLVFGAEHDITLSTGETRRKTFTGMKRSEYDGTYWLYFVEPGTNGKGEIGYHVSDVVIADRVPVVTNTSPIRAAVGSTIHTARGSVIGDPNGAFPDGIPYGQTHDMDCPGCKDTPFTASPRSETYWAS